MKREGRQHGVVRTYRILSDPVNPRPDPRIVSSPPTAGLFSKVPSKPTNHSKFTGKSRCIKSKGSQKLRSSDHLLLAFSGFSASVMLDQLAPSDYDDVDDDQIDEQLDDDREEEDEGEIREDECEMSFCEVGFVLEEVEIDCGDEDDQGWCVVAEL